MNKRYYLVELILYPENQEHVLLLKELITKYNYAYILHDKDKDEEGNLKKEHFHLLLFFNNARWGSSILKEINIDNSNLIQFKEDKVSSIRYLIHSDNNDKFKYDITDIISDINLDLYFKNKDNESNDILNIIEFVSNYVGILTYYQLYYFVIDNNMWSTYRRNYSIVKDLVNERNSFFTNNE